MKLSLPHFLPAAALAALFSLTACTKQEESAKGPQVSPLAPRPISEQPCYTQDCRDAKHRAEAASAAAEAAKQLQASVAAGPKPDPATPESIYKQPTSDFDMGVLRQAFGAKMGDEDIAKHFGNVNGEGDAFKKEANAKDAVSKVNTAVAALAGNRYVLLKLNPFNIEPYDLAIKGFKVNGLVNRILSTSGGQTDFRTGLVISNGAAVSTWTVTDEQFARNIESRRANYSLGLSADVYAFVVGSVPGNEQQLTTVVTKVVLHDAKGAVVGTLMPAAQ